MRASSLHGLEIKSGYLSWSKSYLRDFYDGNHIKILCCIFFLYISIQVERGSQNCAGRFQLADRRMKNFRLKILIDYKMKS